MTKLNVGDRVSRAPLTFKHELPRFGEVVDIYNGPPNGQGIAVEFASVKWDDTGIVDRGYLRNSPTLTVITVVA